MQSQKEIKIFPSRFIKITIYNQSSKLGKPIVIYSSGNMHPYISSNALKNVFKNSEVKPKIEFDVVHDFNNPYSSAQVKIFNLNKTDNPISSLPKDTKVVIEAGYNGVCMNTIFEGYIFAEPITNFNHPNNYIILQLSSAKAAYKIKKQFSVHASRGLKKLISKVEAPSDSKLSKSVNGFGIKLKQPQVFTFKSKLEKPLDISVKANLEEMLNTIGKIANLKIVNTSEDLFEFFEYNGKKLQLEPNNKTIDKNNVISFEVLSKNKSTDSKTNLGAISSLMRPSTNNNIQSANGGTALYYAQDMPEVENHTIKDTEAKLSIMLDGSIKLGDIISFNDYTTKDSFVVKSINFSGSSHGTGPDFKANLELYCN